MSRDQNVINAIQSFRQRTEVKEVVVVMNPCDFVYIDNEVFGNDVKFVLRYVCEIGTFVIMDIKDFEMQDLKIKGFEPATKD